MKNKIARVVLSLVIAFALWMYVISIVNPESEETFYDIPVSYQNDILEERGLMIVSETPTVTLKLKGNRSDLSKLNADNITILVNLAAIQAPGTQMLSYTYNFPNDMPSNAFETLSQSPNLLTLKVENRVKKSVPIQLAYLGTVPEGFIADKENPVMDIAAVEISGPESVVTQIDQAVIQVDLANKTDFIVGAFPYVLCNAEGEPVDAHMVTTNVEEVNLSVKIQAMKEVPLKINLIDGGGATKDTCNLEMSRETIWVCGSESKLRDLTEVELGTVDLATLKDDVNTMSFAIALPEGVTNMTGETEVTATISFPALGRKTLTISKERFLTTGLPAGAEVVWITEVVEVELRGPRDEVKNITEKDIAVTMDFTGEEPGNISKVPKITLSSAYSSVGAVSVSTVTATMLVGDSRAAEG